MTRKNLLHLFIKALPSPPIEKHQSSKKTLKDTHDTVPQSESSIPHSLAIPPFDIENKGKCTPKGPYRSLFIYYTFSLLISLPFVLSLYFPFDKENIGIRQTKKTKKQNPIHAKLKGSIYPLVRCTIYLLYFFSIYYFRKEQLNLKNVIQLQKTKKSNTLS